MVAHLIRRSRGLIASQENQLASNQSSKRRGKTIIDAAHNYLRASAGQSEWMISDEKESDVFLGGMKGAVQGVQEKWCFFTIHCNPSLAYIAVRDLENSQRNASVQSLLLAGNFLYNQ